MADVYQRVSAVGAAVVQKWQEFSGSTYFVRVMGAVLLNSTGGQPGSSDVPANVKGTASTAVVGHVVADASTAVIGSLYPSTAIIGALGVSTAVIGHVVGDASTAIVGGGYDAGPIWATKKKITNSSDMSGGALITAAPTTTLKIRITDLLISPDGAMSITLREETTGTTGTIVGGPYYLSADSVVQITTRGDMWGASSDGPAADKAIQAVASTSGYVTLEAWWRETT